MLFRKGGFWKSMLHDIIFFPENGTLFPNSNFTDKFGNGSDSVDMVYNHNSNKIDISPFKIYLTETLFNFRYRCDSHYNLNHNHFKLKHIKSCHYSQMILGLSTVRTKHTWRCSVYLLQVNLELNRVFLSFPVRGKSHFRLFATKSRCHKIRSQFRKQRNERLKGVVSFHFLALRLIAILWT